jgi:hypothetical protein
MPYKCEFCGIGDFNKSISLANHKRIHKHNNHYKNRFPFINKKSLYQDYIIENKTIKEIGRKYSVSQSTIWVRLKKNGIKIRKSKDINHEKNNGMWKGDKVGYHGVHDWIKKHMISPKICSCCSKLNIDLTNISGKYLRDINDWKWQCRRCHMKEDGRMNNLKKGKNKKGGFKMIKKEQVCPKCGSSDITKVQREMTYKGKPGAYIVKSCDSCGHNLDIKEVIR